MQDSVDIGMTPSDDAITQGLKRLYEQYPECAV